ncbi:hypothetical protein JCM10207_003391 [Rhodosporidiobolus poonsookiae]
MECNALHGDGHGNYRIVIWGNTGAGKSTLAGRLAHILPQVKFIGMDELLWNDDWVMTPTDELRAAIHEQTHSSTSFVTDGNYLKYKDTFYPRATDIVWLDFPWYVTLWRLLRRTFWRWWTQEQLFGTNCRERLSETLFSRESIIWWFIIKHRPLRREFGQLLEANEHGVRDKLRGRFRSTEDVEMWLQEVEKGAKST